MIPKTPLSFLSWILGAFALGACAYAILGSLTTETRPTDALEMRRYGTRAEAYSRESRPSKSDKKQRPSATSTSPGTVVLQLDVVDALLSGGGQQKMFQRMGLTDEDVRRVAEIQAERVGELERLESRHAKVVSDASGEHVAIEAFPEERRLWLDAMEGDLRKLLGDDRALIIARMISISDNDEDVGVYRRELHVKPPNVDGGKPLIEEKSFNEQGEHIDSDYEEVDGQSKSRWSHLLDFDLKK